MEPSSLIPVQDVLMTEEPSVVESGERLDDEELVARSLAGEREAFRTLFERKHRRVFLIARQILGDSGEAEEVVQEVFLTLWNKLDEYRRGRGVDGWLARITTNRSIDRWRSRRTESRAHDEVLALSAVSQGRSEDAGAAWPSGRAEATPEAVAQWRELQAIWDDLAESLPPRQRAAFVLKEIEGAPTREVARALGCSPSTVRSHLAAARATLQEELRERYPELAARYE